MSEFKAGDKVVIHGESLGGLLLDGTEHEVMSVDGDAFPINVRVGSRTCSFATNSCRLLEAPPPTKPASERERKAAAKAVREAHVVLRAAVSAAQDTGIEVYGDITSFFNDIQMTYQPPTPPTKTY